MNTRSVRCSSLPIVTSCPAAQTAPAISIRGDDEAARLGRAVHSALATMIEGGEVGNAIEDASAYHRVDYKLVAPLVWAGVRAWEQLRDIFPVPDVEQQLCSERDGLILTGVTDILAAFERKIRVGDWKTGYADEDHEQQIRGYCWLGLQKYPDCNYAVGIVIRLRDMVRDLYGWSRAELDSWFSGVAADLERDDEYHPGRHCTFCPRSLECEARRKWLSQSLAVMRETQVVDLAALDADHLIDIHGRLGAAEATCKLVRSTLKDEVVARGNRALGSDGRELVVFEHNAKTIDPKPAWPVLQERFGLDRLLDATTIGKGKVEDIAKSLAPRGQKTAAAREIIEELDRAGALVTETSFRLECRRHGDTTAAAITAASGDAIAAAPAATTAD